MKRRPRDFLLPFAGVVVFAAVTGLPLCGMLFTCGCTLAGTAHCNVHHRGGARCPWCAHGAASGAIAYGGGLLAAAAGIGLVGRFGRVRLLATLPVGILAFLLGTSLVGLATAVFWHYPTWFGLHV